MYSSQKHMISTDNYNSEILTHAIIVYVYLTAKPEKVHTGMEKKI